MTVCFDIIFEPQKFGSHDAGTRPLVETHIESVRHRKDTQQNQETDRRRRQKPIGVPVYQIQTANFTSAVFHLHIFLLL